MEKITLERRRKSDFTVNYDNKKYQWLGIKGNVVSKKEIPMEVFDFLQSATSTFRDGELAIVIKDEKSKEETQEIIDNIPDLEEYKANIHTQAEVEALLKGNMLKMEKELKQITSVSEKRFIIDIAKDLVARNELDSSKKREILIKWHGTKLSVADFFEI